MADAKVLPAAVVAERQQQQQQIGTFQHGYQLRAAAAAGPSSGDYLQQQQQPFLGQPQMIGWSLVGNGL